MGCTQLGLSCAAPCRAACCLLCWAALPVWLSKWSSQLLIQQPLTHLCMGHPQISQLAVLAVSSPIIPAAWLVLGISWDQGPCLSALLTSLGNWSLTSASRNRPARLCSGGCRKEHPPLRPAASSQRQSLGLLPPHGPSPLMMSAHPSVCH